MKRTSAQGPLLLNSFIENARTTQGQCLSITACAESLGVSCAALRSWLDGTVTPRKVHRYAIEKWTSQAVLATSWEVLDDSDLQKLDRIQPYGSVSRAA